VVETLEPMDGDTSDARALHAQLLVSPATSEWERGTELGWVIQYEQRRPELAATGSKAPVILPSQT